MLGGAGWRRLVSSHCGGREGVNPRTEKYEGKSENNERVRTNIESRMLVGE